MYVITAASLINIVPARNTLIIRQSTFQASYHHNLQSYRMDVYILTYEPPAWYVFGGHESHSLSLYLLNLITILKEIVISVMILLGNHLKKDPQYLASHRPRELSRPLYCSDVSRPE